MRVRFLLGTLLLGVCLTGFAHAQVPPASSSDEPAKTESSTDEAQFPRERRRPDPIEIEQQKKMEKARNENRQKELKRDTDRLLELATELKQYVDKTNQDVLSLEVIQKAEEIEKLAKNIRSKMKG